jgi:hypothetical protein
LKIKDLIAAAGRARIEEQKQTALTNIQKNKEAHLKKLTSHGIKQKLHLAILALRFWVVYSGAFS